MWALKHTIVYGNISVLGLKTGDWEVASEALNFLILDMLWKLQRVQDHSCCISHPTEVYILCCDSMHHEKHRVKKLCSLLSVSVYIQHIHSLVWYWNTSSDISVKELRHFSLFPRRSVWRCLKLGPQLQILLWKLRSGLWLLMLKLPLTMLPGSSLHSLTLCWDEMWAVPRRGILQFRFGGTDFFF